MKGIRVYLIIVPMLLAAVFLQLDFPLFFQWWLTFLLLGAVFMPLTGVIFKRFSTKGYIFSKIIGAAVSGYIVWLLASGKILPFRAWGAYAVLAACLAANMQINKKSRIYESMSKDKDFLNKILFQEGMFILMLFFWSYIRGIDPKIISLEKYMDFGFMNSILRSDYFPPMDMWYGGEPINYYYLGHYFAAYLTRISFVPSEISYNLMIAVLFAMSFMAAFTIGENLFEICEQNTKNFSAFKYAKTICGLVTGALVTLSGNWHTPVYALFASDDPSKAFSNPYGRYWYPDATRYIGHNPDIEFDKTIHEFPLYSYVVSDMHAHVINMIFVLAVIGIAIAVTMNMISKGDHVEESREPRHWYKEYWPGFCVALFLIGLFPAVNFWDFPIYVVVCSSMYLYANLRLYNYKMKAWLTLILQAVVTGLAAYAVVFPFHMKFDAISSEIKFVEIRTKFYQLAVLYGYQAIFFVMLIVWAIIAYRKHNSHILEGKRGDKQAPLLNMPLSAPPEDGGRNKLFDFIEKTNPADILAMLLFICAFGLIAIPEFIYVKDIYPNSPRGNTMFKLCYQAFIMLTLAIGYTSSRICLLKGAMTAYKPCAYALAVVLLSGAFMYPFIAVHDAYGNIVSAEYKGLDGIKYMETYAEQLTKIVDEVFPEGEEPEGPPESWQVVYSLADDYHIVKYINANVDGQPVIAEANHLSYTTFGRIAANTGCPDTFNWWTHQLLWRNTQKDGESDEGAAAAKFNERIVDLFYLYTTNDWEAAQGYINKYNISYIMVGKLERAKFRNIINEDMLKSLGTIVCQSGDSYLLKVR